MTSGREGAPTREVLFREVTSLSRPDRTVRDVMATEIVSAVPVVERHAEPLRVE